MVLLQALAVLFAVFQYGMRAARQEEGGNSNKILSSVFSPSLIARYVRCKYVRKEVELYPVRCLANKKNERRVNMPALIFLVFELYGCIF